MALDITIRYGETPAASGRVGPGESRLDLALPPLPADNVSGLLEVRVVDAAPPTTASASCISEWLRCGDAVLQGDRVTADLVLDPGSVLGDRTRPHESTLYLTVGTSLVRVVVRVPSLIAGQAAAPAAPAQPTSPTPNAGLTTSAAAPPPFPQPASPGGPAAPAPPPPPSAGAPFPQPPGTGMASPPGLGPMSPPTPGSMPPPAPGAVPPPGAPSFPRPPQAPGPSPMGAAVPPPPGYSPLPPGMTPTPPPMPGAMSIPQPPPPGVPAAPAAYGSPGPAAAPGICRNHPNIPTNQICQWCRNSYCSQCLVDFRGSNLCAWCKQAAVVQMQRQANSCDPRTVMLWARIYNIVMVLGCLAMLGLQFFAYGNTRFGFYSEPMWLAWRYVPAGIGLLMALPPAIGLGQGRRWTYLWEMIILIPSMLLSCFWASCLGIVFWPCAIVLLVFWVRPEVKDFFETPA